MDRAGRADPTSPLDPGVQATAINSVARWMRRLDAGGARDPNEPATRIALIAAEAASLRTLVVARGAAALRPYLDRIEAACGGPPGELAKAVRQLAERLGLPVAPEVVREASAPAVPAIEAVPEPSLIAPPPFLDGAGGAPEPPAFEPPSVRVDSPIRSDALSSGATKLSPRMSGLPQRASESPKRESRPPRQPSAPPEPWGVRPSVDPPEKLDSGSGPSPPGLLGTIFRFRAFNKADRPKPSPAPKPGGVLGLGVRAVRGDLSDRPPRFLSGPPLEGPREPSLRVAPLPRAAVSPRASPSPRMDPERTGRSSGKRRAARPGLPLWGYAALGSVALLGMAIGLVIAYGHGSRPSVATRPAQKPASTSSSAPPAAERLPAEWKPTVAGVEERVKDKPQLQALLEEQTDLARSCRSKPESCGHGWARQTYEALDRVESPIVLSEAPEPLLPPWLRVLDLPKDLPIENDLALKTEVDQNTKNMAGRVAFQQMVFECGAYDEIFDSAIATYGAPTWLVSVVYKESACNPRATSPVGAKGLWQFMPESARAYGLRVEDGIDERLNPIKSTDAALHFLTDLYHTLGAWDLAMAAYNMGPFGLLAELEQACGNAGAGGRGAKPCKVGFWDLAHAGRLPMETTQYVPSIESYALVLQNLAYFHMPRGRKPPEPTSEIIVNPGTRLSLVARASSTSTLHIKELNLEFLGRVVPDGENAVRVPDAQARRAQAFMESWSPSDNIDLCVPDDFDWGSALFEGSRYAKDCPQAPGTP